MLAPDGPCAGAQVIFQEDNAGPHTNHEYSAWMQEAFAQYGWKIELQASQGSSSSLYSIVFYDYLSCNCT
jgi:hypothetical protein